MPQEKTTPLQFPAVLIVDDRSENLDAIESVLDGMNTRIVRAVSGTAALRAVLQQDFAVILLDVQMPQMDGFEAATLIRARGQSAHTPIIFITAIERSEERVFEGYQSGAVDYIFKPFNPQILRAKVGVFVDLYQTRQELALLNERLEQKVRERTSELAASERSFHDLAESALVGIYRASLRGEIHYVNAMLARLLGFDSPEEMIHSGTSIRYQDPRDGQDFLETLQRDGKVESFETVILTQSGALRNALLSAVLNADQVIGTIMDITERNRLLAELEISRQREQEARELVSLERISGTSSPSVTAQMFGVLPLRDSAPELFDTLVQSFRQSLDKALEQRILRVEYNIENELRQMAEQLGPAKAGPRDVIDIYVRALKAISQGVPPKKAQAYAEESRLLVLELMGNMVSFYRKYFAGRIRNPTTETDPGLKQKGG